jgi:hypothetical protein
MWPTLTAVSVILALFSTVGNTLAQETSQPHESPQAFDAPKHVKTIRVCAGGFEPANTAPTSICVHHQRIRKARHMMGGIAKQRHSASARKRLRTKRAHLPFAYVSSII